MLASWIQIRKKYADQWIYQNYKQNKNLNCQKREIIKNILFSEYSSIKFYHENKQ